MVDNLFERPTVRFADRLERAVSGIADAEQVRHLDAVQHPMSPPSYQLNEKGQGAYLYQGKDASVALNKDGQVVTAWANNHNGWRY